MSGEARILLNSALLTRPDGKLAISDDCCRAAFQLTPCWEGTPCRNAPWGDIDCLWVPKHMTVSVAGLSWYMDCCNGYWFFEGPIIKRSMKIASPPATDPNGDFLLSINAGSLPACHWSLLRDIDNPMDERYWPGEDCTPGDGKRRATALERYDYTLDYDKSAGTWTLIIQCVLTHSWGFWRYLRMFKGTVSGDCDSGVLTFTNDFSPCDYEGDFPDDYDYTYVGDGGTVTVQWGDVEGPGPCPGGSPVYTSTDLCVYLDKTVNLDDGVCYQVTLNETDNPPDGDVTVVDSYNECKDCCEDV